LYTRRMRSVADGLRRQTLAHVLTLPLTARVELALSLGDDDLDLFLLFSSLYGSGDQDGIAAKAWLMVSMSVFGAMGAAVSIGGRIAGERQAGWTRQLRLTPMPGRMYVASKAITALAVAVPALALVYAVGAIVEGVRLPAARWAEAAGWSLLALAPFVALGIWLGHRLTVDVLGPLSGALFTALGILGGVWFPIDQLPSAMQGVAKALPSRLHRQHCEPRVTEQSQHLVVFVEPEAMAGEPQRAHALGGTVAQHQLPVRTQHAADLGEAARRIGPEVERVDAQDPVELPIAMGQRLHDCALESQPARRDRRAVMLRRRREHVVRRIDTGDASRPRPREQRCKRETAAEPHLQHGVRWLNVQQLDRTLVHRRVGSIHDPGDEPAAGTGWLP